MNSRQLIEIAFRHDEPSNPPPMPPSTGGGGQDDEGEITPPCLVREKTTGKIFLYVDTVARGTVTAFLISAENRIYYIGGNPSGPSDGMVFPAPWSMAEELWDGPDRWGFVCIDDFEVIEDKPLFHELVQVAVHWGAYADGQAKSVNVPWHNEGEEDDTFDDDPEY